MRVRAWHGNHCCSNPGVGLCVCRITPRQQSLFLQRQRTCSSCTFSLIDNEARIRAQCLFVRASDHFYIDSLCLEISTRYRKREQAKCPPKP